MKTRYVYFDEITGKIEDIISTKKSSTNLSYIKCTNSEVEGFILGTESTNNWIIAYDRELKKYRLLKKNNIIRLRNTNNRLYKIKYKKDSESDLVLTYYSDNILGVTLDISRIAPLYQTNFSKEVRFERGSEIRIIIKKKNNKKIFKEIIINAQKLLNSVQLFFEIPTVINSNNVEFYTYKVFNSFVWSKGMFRLMSPIKERIKFDIHKADTKIKSNEISHHLIIYPIENGIKIKNNIESLKLIKFYKDIEFFIVDKHDPNILYEKFFLYEKDLKRKEIFVKLKESINGRSILYNHKYISVLLKGST